MKVVKNADERRNQILDEAQKLFLTKGFHKTTINDILKAVGIAKGTFYYYYESKMDILDDLADRFSNQQIEMIEKIASSELSALEKLTQVISGPHQRSKEKEKLIAEFHKIDNAELHQRTLVEAILKVTPILAKIVEQGVKEGVFTTPYPRESIEILIVAIEVLFDDGLFAWSYEEKIPKLKAMARASELILGAKEGAFSFISKGWAKGWGRGWEDENRN